MATTREIEPFSLNEGALKGIYRKVALIRGAEQAIAKQLRSGKLSFSLYPLTGQELAPAVLTELLEAKDQMVDHLGDAVSEMQIVEWIAADGAQVTEGDPIYSIESGKSVLEIAAPTTRKLLIKAKPGEIFPVGHLVSSID